MLRKHLSDRNDGPLHGQPSEGCHFLVERDGAFLLCRTGDGAETDVAGCFGAQLVQSQGGVVALREGLDQDIVLPPGELLVQGFYKQLSIGQARFKMKVYQCEWASPALWWEARLLAGPFGVAPAAFLKNMMKNHWRRWCEVIESLKVPRHAALRRGFDRQRKRVDFWRCLPEHTVSTLGLLLISAWRAHSARGSGCREQSEEFMSCFLDTFFADESCEVVLYMDPIASHRCTTVHPNASLAIPIDSGKVHLRPFLMEVGEELRSRCLNFLLVENSQRFDHCSTVPIKEFLCMVFSLRLSWLVRQVFGQVAALVDSVWSSKGFTQCPYEVSEDAPSLPKHARRDVDLLHKLALGEGMPHSGKRAWQQGPFVRAYEMLTPASKRQRTFSAQELNNGVLLDLLQAAQGIFASARHVSISLDGTRLGNKDVSFLAAGAFCNGDFRIMWAPVMVLPDHLRRTESWQGTKQLLEEEESADVRLEKDWWESALRCFLSSGSEGESKNRLAKYRLASYYWLMMLNTTLHTCFGFGLEAFMSPETLVAIQASMGPEDDEAHLEVLRKQCQQPWRWLGVPMDQCSVGVCAANFLRGQLKVCMEPLFDPSHRVSNDLLLAIKSSGWFPLLLAMKMVYSVNYGPWDGAKWWLEAKQSLADAMELLGDGLHPLFEAFVPSIANDMGEKDAHHNDEWVKTVYGGLMASPAVSCKGPRMALCRWMSWLHCSRHWDPLWHRRLFALVIWGLRLGYLKGSPAAGGVRSDRVRSVLNSHGNQSLKVQEKCGQELRCAGVNTLHSVTLVYMEGWPLQRRIRLLMVVSKPLERWFHNQHLENRDEARTLQFYMRCAGDAGLSPLAETFASLCDKKNLAYLGMVSNECDLPLSALEPGASLEGYVADESEFVASAMSFAFAVVGQRLRSFLWHAEGLPGVLPMLLSEHQPTVDKCLAYLQDLDSLWAQAQAKGHGDEAIATQVRQSFLQNPIPAQALRILRGRSFRDVPPDLSEAIASLFAVGQTVMCEQANRAARNVESRDQDNLKMSALRLWMAPYRAQVLSQSNAYKEIKHEEHTVQSTAISRTHKLSAQLHSPTSVTAALPLKWISSAKREAGFETTSPANAARAYAHVAVWRHCAGKDQDWDKMPRLWLCQLLSVGMLVKRKGETAFCFIVAVVCGIAGLAWEADAVVIAGKRMYFPRRTNDGRPLYRWVVVNDISNWVGYQVQWVGECWRIMSARRSAPSSSEPQAHHSGFMALPTTGLQALPWLSAHGGFKNMNFTALKDLARLVGCDFSVGVDLFDLLMLLAKHFVPGKSELDYHDMLASRCQEKDAILAETFFDSAEVRDAFDEQDLKILDGWRQERSEPSFKKLSERLAAHKTSALALVKAGAKKPRGPDKAFQGKVSEGTRLYPAVVQAAALSESEALTFCPEGSRVHKSRLDNRWRVSWQRHNISRCWTMHGEVKAFAICARHIWEVHHASGGKPCPFEWISRVADE